MPMVPTTSPHWSWGISSAPEVSKSGFFQMGQDTVPGFGSKPQVNRL